MQKIKSLLSYILKAGEWIITLISVPFLFLYAMLVSRKKKLYIWGTTPIISYKYWSLAMREIGYETKTLMSGYYSSINKKEDYDLYFEDLLPGFIRHIPYKLMFQKLAAFCFILRNARVFHLPFHGGPLGNTFIYKIEAVLFKLAHVKTVVTPYGSDAYLYSKISDPCLKNALLLSYPGGAIIERKIQRKINYWTKWADCMITGLMLDGIGRWDVPITQIIQIDAKQWQSKKDYSNYDGKNGTVKVIHTPNHKGFKGTEFLVKAIDELKDDGIKVELILLENVPNDRVREIMQGVDILAEQFIATGYALSGIEGMATGLPVMSNLEDNDYLRIFRRYSFLDECPIVSSSPETLKQNLKILIANPELRKELGLLGRQYVEKYHSFRTAQYMFENIYKKLFDEENVDLMNLFHPLKSKYPGQESPLRPPLIQNQFVQDTIND